jgi:cytochrome c-type biogenesis protein CcmE
MKKGTIVRIIVGVVLIGGALSYFVYQTMQSSWAYYYSVDDFAAHKAAVANNSLRIAGRVGKGSVQQDSAQMLTTFTLAGSETVLPVSYVGVVPDNFAEDVEVVVEGQYTTDSVFEATKLMTRCESKYKAKVK